MKPHPYAHTDAFWTGYLSTRAAMVVPEIERHPKEAAKELRRTLEEFLRSPLPSDELRETLRRYIR